MNKLTIIWLLVLACFQGFSQVDDEFWFAAPYTTVYNDGLDPDINDVEIVITAMQATRVTLEIPAKGFSFTTPLIGTLSSYTINLGAIGLTLNDILTPPQSLPIDPGYVPYNNGLKITSDPGVVTASFKLTDDDAADQYSLKGRNALGSEFYVSTQNTFPNTTTNNYNGFTIVATANNTTIEIHRNDIWGNNPLAIPATPASPVIETITLNAGQTFTVRSLDNSVVHHINGVYVRSVDDSKPIAITFWDDMVQKALNTGAGVKDDLCGDQTIPTSVAGTDYLVMKGGMLDIPTKDGGEKVYLTGTVDGTQIDIYNVQGGWIESFTINAGEVIYRELDFDFTYIKSDNSIYVNHYSAVGSTSTNGNAPGAAVLPPVGACTGSHDVIFTRSANPQDVLYLNILAENDTNPSSPYFNKAAEGFYLLTDEELTHIPSTYFNYSNDSAYIVLDRINFEIDYIGDLLDPGQTAHVYNRNAKFHLGVIEGHLRRNTKYGYFSDYGGGSASAGIGGPYADPLKVVCNLGSIQLVAFGGKVYDWEVFNPAPGKNTLDYLSADDIYNPIYTPDTFETRQFNVDVSLQCGGDTTLSLLVATLPQPVAYFETEADDVCSPDSVLISENVRQDDVDLYWYFQYASTPGRIDNTTTATPFYQSLPPNDTDSLQYYNITMQASYARACTDIYTKTITVKPSIHSSFEFLGDSVSCHPLTTQFKNNSSGNVDSTSFLWNFGDYKISYELDSVEHTFSNYSLSDTNFTIQLVTRSPFDCLDTSSAEVTVYPRVKALFSSTPSQSCSPLIFNVNPVNSVGADSIFWGINYFYGDSSFVRTDKSSISLTHYDTSVAQGPDTLFVSMIAKNNFGCSDTAVPHQLITYPSAVADFDISESVICDGDTIMFSNNSDGYNLNFYWNLGDGTAPNDSVPSNKPYFNPSAADVDYSINLTVISENNCIDQKDTILTVHPFIDANFGVNYVRNCSPLEVTLTDNAFRALNYDWDLGDGNVYNNSGDFTHIYTNNLLNTDTTYTIKLVVGNAQGCFDSISRDLTVKPQVVASMNLINKRNCSPLDVTFQNLAQGGSYYVWDLGGNNLRTDTALVDFNEVYSNNTAEDIVYPISLTAMNTAGCDSTVYDTVVVFADIFANFTFAKDSACSPFLPAITNNSAAGAKIYEWYQDGVLFSSAENPTLPEFTNTSDSPDSYEYTLITYGMNDAEHRQCADTHSTRLRVFPELNASFTLAETASCQPLNTLVTNNTNLQDSSQFLWYLDNYIYSSDTDPGNLFINNFTNNDAVHTLRLTGQTNHGCKDTISANVDVYAYIDANFTINKPSICSGDSFAINRINTQGAIDNYLWDFGISSSSTSLPEFNFSYDNTTANPVTEIIRLTVSNSQCDSSWIDSIVVNPLVTASFNADIDSGCHPHNTIFNNLTTNANSYYWNFGDGINSSEFEPAHTFNNFDAQNNKSFSVRLIAESEYRCRDTTYGLITSYAKPIANFLMPVAVSCPPFEWSVINNSEGPSGMQYFWDLGTSTSTSFEPTELYDNATSEVLYETISLTTSSLNGCTDSISREISIYPRINVDFNTYPEAGCSPLDVEFVGDTLNVQQMVWYIDDILFSAQISPTNRFMNETNSDAEHEVKFIAYSRYNCVDSSIGTITVYPTPNADFVGNPLPAQYDTINDQTLLSFNNVTNHQNIWNYQWNFGDGNTGSQNEQLFDYYYGSFFWGPKATNNRIPVELVAINQDHAECRDTISREIIIIPPIPLVDIGEEISGCIPLTVDFSSNTKYAYSDSYEWNFGDGSEVVTESYPEHTFNKAGTYTVKLNVEGDGGIAADYKIITVYPQPITDFSFNDTVVFVASLTEESDEVNFYNQTKYGVGYEWYFDKEDFLAGQAPDSEEKDVIWAYDEIGVYYPVLVSYSSEGCSDTLISEQHIRVLGEGILEFPSGFFVDPNTGPADESNTSQITPNMYVFYPKNSGVDKYKLEVYNRWGTLMFETDDPGIGWNGYFEGVIAKQDVYIWRAKGNYTNGQPFDLSGDVTLFHTAVNNQP
jgi:PKD repeat protein